jgi:membrane protease YdiL (CAAX protease family)
VFFFLVVCPLTAGFVEELIWRGYFLERLLSAGRGRWRAIALSSVSFAFIHGFFLPLKLAVTFLFGVIAGAYYHSERNLPVLMASHVALEVIAFGLPFLV